MEELLTILRQDWHLALVATALVYSIHFFVKGFVIPARALRKEIDLATLSLIAVRQRTNGNVIELDDFTNEAMTTPALLHLWKEYAKTLHPQRAEDELGQSRIVRWRATTLAESFFTEQAVVDSRLKTEFFKHLPGILTGIGIIGTFFGLINGLTQFSVAGTPTEAQDQLRKLINSVGHAFWVSAAAITLAMLFTWIEKWQTASLYKEVENIRELIDSLFKMGAGEEYLERLATASETSATQAAQIKDALVADLRDILTKLTNQQIAAHSAQTVHISGQVGVAIAQHLGGPIEEIASAVKAVSANQGNAVNTMLTDVLVKFSEQMEKAFGGQMNDLSALLQEASTAMNSAATEFKNVASNMETQGTKTVDAMGDRLTQALAQIETRQAAMNQQMTSFVGEINTLIKTTQTDSNEQLKKLLDSLEHQVNKVIVQLQAEAKTTTDAHETRQELLWNLTDGVMKSLSSNVTRLISQIEKTDKTLKDTTTTLASTTMNAITKMNSGAETLYVAASDFAKAGKDVYKTMQTSVTAVETLKRSTDQLSSAANEMKSILEDHARSREAFAKMISDLKSTIENGKRDASLTSDVIKKLEAAAQQLGKAEQQSEVYLKGVTEVLEKCHESFAQNLERTLRDANRQFQRELATAVELLSGAIKNLGDILDLVPPRK